MAALGVHLAGIGLIILLGWVWPGTADDIIEVTLAAGTENARVEASAEEQSPQQEQRQEVKPEEDPEAVPDPEKAVQPREQQSELQPVRKPAGSESSGSARKGDGGQDEFTSMPKILKQVKPDYPPAARNQDKQGKVLVRLLISSRGVVEQADITGSSGYPPLDEAVIKAVYKWRFAPAKNRYGRPCACRVVVPVNFVLK